MKTNEAYEKFLELLGDQVPLKGRTEWSGGLDTKSTHLLLSLLTVSQDDNDGEYSVACTHPYGDVMFHVATMMKHVDGDVQQVSCMLYQSSQQ